MKILMWPAIWKNPTQQKRNFMLFASKEHPFDLLEAIPLALLAISIIPFLFIIFAKFSP